MFHIFFFTFLYSTTLLKMTEEHAFVVIKTVIDILADGYVGDEESSSEDEDGNYFLGTAVLVSSGLSRFIRDKHARQRGFVFFY